jgi:UDP-glucose 4-epimerase
VADQLLTRGHEVAIVDDLSSGKKENVPEGAVFYERDIRGGCAGVFEEFEPDALRHQAAQMDVRRSVREPDFDADVNVLGTVRLLQRCAERGVRRVVFAPTGGAVYGEQREFPAPEDHPSTRSRPTASPSSSGSATCASIGRSMASSTRRCATPTSTVRGNRRPLSRMVSPSC